jgi:hypothetical protein
MAARAALPQSLAWQVCTAFFRGTYPAPMSSFLLQDCGKIGSCFFEQSETMILDFLNQFHTLDGCVFDTDCLSNGRQFCF